VEIRFLAPELIENLVLDGVANEVDLVGAHGLDDVWVFVDDQLDHLGQILRVIRYFFISIL
jgi:hypothetical protein